MWSETYFTMEQLMKSADAHVVKKVAILAEGDAASRNDIVFLQKLPLFQLNQHGEYEIID